MGEKARERILKILHLGESRRSTDARVRAGPEGNHRLGLNRHSENGMEESRSPKNHGDEPGRTSPATSLFRFGTKWLLPGGVSIASPEDPGFLPDDPDDNGVIAGPAVP